MHQFLRMTSRHRKTAPVLSDGYSPGLRSQLSDCYDVMDCVFLADRFEICVRKRPVAAEVMTSLMLSSPGDIIHHCCAGLTSSSNVFSPDGYISTFCKPFLPVSTLQCNAPSSKKPPHHHQHFSDPQETLPRPPSKCLPPTSPTRRIPLMAHMCQSRLKRSFPRESRMPFQMQVSIPSSRTARLIPFGSY